MLASQYFLDEEGQINHWALFNNRRMEEMNM